MSRIEPPEPSAPPTTTDQTQAPRPARPSRARPASPPTGPWPELIVSEHAAIRLEVPQYLLEVLAVIHGIPRVRIGPARVFNREGQERLRAAVAEFLAARERMKELETELQR